MQECQFYLLLGGDRNHVLRKTATVPELEILRTLHGDEAVVDIEVVGNPEVNHREERERLKKVFRKNVPASDASGRKNIVDVVFPNPRANLPTELKDIGITNDKPAKRKGESGGNSGGSKRNAQTPASNKSAEGGDLV